MPEIYRTSLFPSPFGVKELGSCNSQENPTCTVDVVSHELNSNMYKPYSGTVTFVDNSHSLSKIAPLGPYTWFQGPAFGSDVKAINSASSEQS